MAAGDIVVVNENTFGKKANYYDGTDDYMLADAHAVARVAANDTVGTYTAWIYIDAIGVLQTILSAGDNNATTQVMTIDVGTSGELKIGLVVGGTVQFIVAQNTASLTARTWTHVAVVQDGVLPAFYINGIVSPSTATTALDTTAWYDELTAVDKFAIGVKETNATHIQDFKGAIGQVKYFNIAMTAAEILNEFKGDTDSNTTRAAAIETARVFDISMEDDGTTDSGSGADNGTLTGDAHYGGYVSNYTQAIERNVTGHAAEDMNTVDKGNGNYETIIKRGD